MALKKHSLLSQRDLQQTPRLNPADNGGTKRVRMALSAGAELLPVGTPIARDSSTNLWVPYTQPSDAAVYTITAGSTAASAGTFQVILDGLASVHVFDVTAAAMETELQALLVDAQKGWTVTVAPTTGTDLGDNDAVVTITFDEAAGAPTVDLDASGLTGTAHALASTNAGTQLNGTNEIVGFILEANVGDSDDTTGVEGVRLDATDDVLAMTLHMGVAYAPDVNTALILTALTAFGAPTSGELDTALRSAKLRDKGLVIRGLTQVP